MKPATYCVSFEQVSDLADALSELDGLADYCIATRKPEVKALVVQCHQHLQQALGEHVEFVYGKDPEAA